MKQSRRQARKRRGKALAGREENRLGVELELSLALLTFDRDRQVKKLAAGRETVRDLAKLDFTQDRATPKPARIQKDGPPPSPSLLRLAPETSPSRTVIRE